ncbi:MAG: hypothetical protein ACW99U_18800 [Candidatus Thorarchaeota archaeon]|jgi:hypothetical protein
MIRKRKRRQEVESPKPRRPQFEFTKDDEEYVNMMLKKSAIRRLQKHRKNPPPKKNPPLIDPEIDELLSKIETKVGIIKGEVKPIKNCRKCYFSKSFRIIGVEWYCLCSNIAKVAGQSRGKWVHCESNLKCWRKPQA